MDYSSGNFGQKGDAMSDFVVSEMGLVERLGVTRAILKMWRDANLVRGRDWDAVAKNVMLTQEAAGRLSQSFGIPAPISEKNAAPPSLNASTEVLIPEAEEVSMVRPFRNPQLIEARRKNGALIMVRVQSNVNFRTGMVLRAVQGQSLWVLKGRCPRYPGKY